MPISQFGAKLVPDKIKMKLDDLQKMTYRQCYQYERAMLSVSCKGATARGNGERRMKPSVEVYT